MRVVLVQNCIQLRWKTRSTALRTLLNTHDNLEQFRVTCKVLMRAHAHKGKLSGRFHLISRKISRFQERFQDFKKDFGISRKISGFQERFRDFEEDFGISRKISGFQERFRDFEEDFGISRRFQDFSGISPGFQRKCTRFREVANPPSLSPALLSSISFSSSPSSNPLDKVTEPLAL